MVRRAWLVSTVLFRNGGAARPTANFRTKLVNIRRPEPAGMAAEYALIVVQSAAGSRQR
jgi:hypothetical protein